MSEERSELKGRDPLLMSVPHWELSNPEYWYSIDPAYSLHLDHACAKANHPVFGAAFREVVCEWQKVVPNSLFPIVAFGDLIVLMRDPAILEQQEMEEFSQALNGLQEIELKYKLALDMEAIPPGEKGVAFKAFDIVVSRLARHIDILEHVSNLRSETSDKSPFLDKLLAIILFVGERCGLSKKSVYADLARFLASGQANQSGIGRVQRRCTRVLLDNPQFIAILDAGWRTT
jgi:hypothetical protein